MKSFMETDPAEEYERIRHTIGQPFYDSLPTSPYQPIPEEESLQVTQPLNRGGEHEGEANYDALEGRNCAEEKENDDGPGSGREEETDVVPEKKEAEGNTRGDKTRPGLKEVGTGDACSFRNDSRDGNDAEEREHVEAAPQSSSPIDEDADKAHDNHSSGQDDFDWLDQIDGKRKEKEAEASTHREIVAQGSGKDDGKGFPIHPEHPHKHQQSSPRFVKRYEAQDEQSVQVDLDGNLTPSTKRVLESRQPGGAELGEAQEVNDPGALPGCSNALDEKMVVGTASLPPYIPQCPAVALNGGFGNGLEAASSSPREGQAPFEVDDFLISSPKTLTRNPPALPTSVPLAASPSSLQQRAGPPRSLPCLTPRQAGLVHPQARPSPFISCGPAASAVQPPVAKSARAPVVPHSQQRVTSNIREEPKLGSRNVLGVQKPPMKGNAAKDRAWKTCDSVAQMMSEVTGRRQVFMQNGGRPRIIKMPRPTALNVHPPRPPRYPTPPSNAQQPAPMPPPPSQSLESLQQDLLGWRRQRGSAANHAEVLKLLDAFTNLPPRPTNSNGMFWTVAPGMDRNRDSVASNSATPGSGNATAAICGNAGPARDEGSQGPSTEAVLASPEASSSAGRNSVKRKLELTAEERQEKKRIRAMRNRQSAEKSRRRRKVYATSLESNVQILREQSQEWRRRYFAGLMRLSHMQRDIRTLYGNHHKISTPEMHEVVDMVGDMVRGCPYTFKREEPEIELRSIGEDGRRGGRGRGARGGRGRGARGGRGRGAGRGSRGNRGGRGE